MTTAVPEQVQRQMDKAANIHQELYGQATEVPPGQPAEAEAAETTTEDVAAQPAASVQEAPPEPVAPEQTVDYWRRRFETVQGKLNAEVPQLHRQLRERDAQLQDMESRLNDLRKKPEESEKPIVTDKDVEDFGADLVDLVRRVATEVVRAEATTLAGAMDARFAALAERLGQVQETVVISAEERFWNKVRELVPDWVQIDSTESWAEFLDSRIPGTRKTYRTEANDAVTAGDPVPIKELVDIWRASRAAPEAPPAAPAPVRQPAANKPDLQRQVAPSSSKASTPSAGPKIWSGSEYEFVFSPQASRTYTADQLEKLQADANAALVEGRVRW